MVVYLRHIPHSYELNPQQDPPTMIPQSGSRITTKQPSSHVAQFLVFKFVASTLGDDDEATFLQGCMKSTSSSKTGAFHQSTQNRLPKVHIFTLSIIKYSNLSHATHIPPWGEFICRLPHICRRCTNEHMLSEMKSTENVNLSCVATNDM